jgi:hypothetical protein
MKRIICAISILFIFNTCQSQTISDWITVEGQAPVQNITQSEAIKIAIENAERDAIERFCGVNIQSQSLVQNFKLGVDIIESVSYGYVVQAETLSIGREDFRKSPKDPFMDLIKVQMKLKVAKPEDKSDPYFKINAKICKNVFVEGEMSDLTIQSTKDCYINIFNIAEDGKVYQIYPLYKATPQVIKEGEPWKYPHPLVAACLPGYNENTEIIKVIATKEPIDFLSFVEDGTDFELIQGMKVWKRAELGLEQLVKTLISIPMCERAENTITYKIFKKE